MNNEHSEVTPSKFFMLITLVNAVIKQAQRRWMHNSRTAVLGHKTEIQVGKYRHRRHIPPRIPKHPLLDVRQNMNELTTYADLKLRWRQSSHTPISRNRMKIARKWKVEPNWAPRPRPTCSFIHHSKMPHDLSRGVPSLPPPGPLDLTNVFCVFKTSSRLQHKVTVGDLVQTERIKRREAGEKIVFGTVLLAGSKDWTIIGKPTVPYVRVHCTIEQQTLSKEMLVYMYKPRRRVSRFKRVRQWVTMLRVDKIEIDPKLMDQNPAPVHPPRLLDLWANRWMTADELRHVDLDKAEQIYDSQVEHKPGIYQRRGLTADYRFPPDPKGPPTDSR
jgi:large subunit ribosomal protein L21